LIYERFYVPLFLDVVIFMQHKSQHRRFKKNGDSIVVEFTRCSIYF